MKRARRTAVAAACLVTAVLASSPSVGDPLPEVVLEGGAEYFDLGGEGIGYHDNTPGNQGDCQYRTSEDVDIFVSPDTAGGNCVVSFETGEWLAYTVTVPKHGSYNIELRASTRVDSPDHAFSVEVDDVDLTGPVRLPDTGGWDRYEWLGTRPVPLAAGTHVFKLKSEQQYFDVNSARLVSTPGVVEAENFDTGGQGIGYQDGVPGNQGDCQYRTGEDVDVFAAPSDASVSFCVVRLESGEWLAYTINAPISGGYDLAIRVARQPVVPGAAFHVEIDGMNATGTLVLPDSGGGPGFEWLGKRTVNLSAGVHVLKIVSEQLSFDLDALRYMGPLFGAGLEGAALEPFEAAECGDLGCWQDVSGMDTRTGFSWPPDLWGGSGRFQLVADAPVTPATIGDHIVNDVRTVVGPTGAETRALYSEIKQSGCCGLNPQLEGVTQSNFQLFPAAQTGDVYISYWLMFQPNLEELMGACGPNIEYQWRAPFTWKTAGDYRVILQVQRDRDPGSCAFVGPLYWRVAGNNEANCELHAPPPGERCPPPPTNLWEERNYSVAVPVGRWFKFEAFWHRSSGNDGRVWMAVDGQVIADHYGPNTGAWNRPIDRIMVMQLYSSTAYPIYQWIDDIELWDRFPPKP